MATDDADQLAQAEAELAGTEETLDDIDQLADQLAAHSILSEERHEQIINEVAECQARIESLTAQVQSLPALSQSQTESPVLSQLLNQLVELRAEVGAIQAELKNLQQSRTPQAPSNSESPDSRPSNPQPSRSESEMETPEPPASGEGEGRAVTTPASPKRRFRKI